MFAYPVELTPDGKFLMVTFPDIPEANSQGDSIEDALEMAKDALESAIDWYIEKGKPIPAPSNPKRGQRVVELPASVSAKVLLRNEMIAQKVRPVELARRLRITPQEVTRLIDLRHATKIDGIAGALKALGKTLEVRAI
ncbi:MAG: type II toxin-antitoxin system HicB family antitoxin [Terracidiphilus sp.]